MARFLVFAAWIPEDVALWNSRWMAEQTVRLATFAEAALMEGRGAVREALESALEDSSLTEWLNENDEEGYLGVLVLAQQLVDRMVVSR